MDHAFCLTVISGLAVAVKTLAFLYWKKDKKLISVLEKFLEREMQNLTTQISEFSLNFTDTAGTPMFWTDQCMSWCKEQHFIYQFSFIWLIGWAIIFLMIHSMTDVYYQYLMMKAPELKPVFNFILRNNVWIAGALMLIFILINLHLSGRVDLPFIR